MRIKDLISPTDGLFSHMPDDIWGELFDTSLVDLELYSRIGELDASPLVEALVDSNGILDVQKLADLLYQRFGRNWDRIWKALIAEYDIMLTTTLSERRSNMKEHTSEQEYGKTDTLEFIERKDVEENSGDDKLKIDYNSDDVERGSFTDRTEDKRKASGKSKNSEFLHGVGGVSAAPTSRTDVEEELLASGNLYEDDTKLTREYGVDGLRKEKRGDDKHTTTHGLKVEREKLGKEKQELGGKDTLTDKDHFFEEFESEGSSPLRTFQALITEEIEGRSGEAWNFTDIIISNVQEIIASIIWKRRRGYFS